MEDVVGVKVEEVVGVKVEEVVGVLIHLLDGSLLFIQRVVTFRVPVVGCIAPESS